MKIESTGSFEEIYSNIADSEYARIAAKIDAWDIHEVRNTPKSSRPHIDENTLTQGYNIAHNDILIALKYLVNTGKNSELTDEKLQKAAQILEKLYLNRPFGYPNRMKELHTAALAYYLSGHYARAFVIMRRIYSPDEASADLMCLMFLRKLSHIRDIALHELTQKQYMDAFLTRSVKSGEMSENEVIDAALRGTLNRVYLLFHEYARTGKEQLIEEALSLSNVSRRFAIEQLSQEWWWTFHCTLALLQEYHRNSLWWCLGSMVNDDPSNLVKKYIISAFSRKPISVLELWRSQSHVVENIKDGQSYCLKMPTSSGKTRIAELSILKFLLDTQVDSDKKCLYIAPYRALAVEIEQSLRSSFNPLAIGVSQLYGSYDLNPAESLIIDESKILIATPEKVDAVLRYNDEIAQQIGLIIVDEGHIIDDDERGLRYEVFLHRLIMRFERKGVRMLFISAVMPNVDQFSRWITGKDSDEGVLVSDWRATRQRLGVLIWNGEQGRVEYTHTDQIAIEQDAFIPQYFTKFNEAELKIAKCGYRVYPGKNSTKGQILALAAMQAVNEGTTLLFTTRRSYVENIAEDIIEVIKIQEKINASNQVFSSILPIRVNNSEKIKKLSHCITSAKETTGADSIIVKALEKGFVVHHGGVPRALRTQLEGLIREGILQLVVSTTTLAQGVNLSIRTILIHSLYNNKKILSTRDFWNLCGRAGRAMTETEGHIYILAESKEETTKIKKQLKIYIQKARSDAIVSGIKLLLENIVQEWKKQNLFMGPIDISIVCQQLADNNEELWMNDLLQRRLQVLDSQLLALIKEQDVGINSSAEDLIEKITNLFKDSMVFLQLNNTSVIATISQVDAVTLIVQRVRHVIQVCKTPHRLNCYYSMALSMKGCILIEQSKHELMDYLKKAESYMNWLPEKRAEYVINLCIKFLMPIDDVGKNNKGEEPVDCWSQILQQWLLGKNAAHIVTTIKLPVEWDQGKTMKVSTLIDELCEFRLPWGLNALSMFWKAADTIQEDVDSVSFLLPEIVSYFASMLQFGVHDPIATVALARGLGNRQAALALATLYTGPLDGSSILGWLKTLETQDVAPCTEDTNLRDLLTEFVTSFSSTHTFDLDFDFSARSTTLTVESYLQGEFLVENTRLMYLTEGNMLHLLTENIDYVGTVEIQDSKLLKDLQAEKPMITIERIDHHDDETIQLVLSVNKLHPLLQEF